MIDSALVDVTNNNVHNLKMDAIADVKTVINNQTKFDRGYNERASSYMVKLQGENRWRRVYHTPIGNVAVTYIKSEGSIYYCEIALEEAIMRKDES